MNKCITLILAVTVTFVNSNDVCTKDLSGIDAFKYAYQCFTIFSFHRMPKEERDIVKQYFNELYISSTEGYQLNMLLSTSSWCHKFYKDEVETCQTELKNGGYKGNSISSIKQMSSSDSLRFSYRYTTKQIIELKNKKTLAYYEYVLTEYNKILENKRLRNPVEFCKNVSAIHLPSNYAGLFEDNNMPNAEINVQNQENNQNAGEGSRLSKEVLDSDGHVIDLNFPPIID